MVSTDIYIHPQALVETEQIGGGTRIWAFSHVLNGAIIGSNCNIGDHCFIEGPQITPVRSAGPTPVPSAGATGQAGQAGQAQIDADYLSLTENTEAQRERTGGLENIRFRTT